MNAGLPSAIFQIGDLLNNTYRIEAILGRGGTSEVYQARSEISGRVMAVKALRAEFASNEDFLVLMTREEDIRDIQHDAIVRYFDTQRMPNGVVYLVMDHIDGPGLDAKLKDGGMTAADLMVVGKRVCEGLIAAHERNIVHRDLSPDNIILRNDDPKEAVIIDFGIAKDTNPGAETIVGNEFAGKYAYAAPEQLSGNTDPRSDIYSLGALLLSTFRGKKPDIGNNPMEVVQKKGEPLDLEGVPNSLRQILARMCDPDPAMRFQTARELLSAFKDPDSLVAGAPAALDPLGDVTIIAPAVSKPKPSAAPAQKAPAAKEAPAAKKKGGMMKPLVAVGAVAAIGAGIYFGGILGPNYPLADPYTLVITRDNFGLTKAEGVVPSVEIQDILNTRITGIGGMADLTLASGEIAATWGDGLIQMFNDADDLEEFRMIVTGNTVTVTGLAETRDTLAVVQDAFDAGLPPGFDGSTNFALGPRFLAPDVLRPILALYADCGVLQLQTPPPMGFGLQEPILITGQFASEDNKAQLQNAIAQAAGDRPIRIEAEVLNPALCQIDVVLPDARPGGIEVRMSYGDREGENLSGTYRVGENPVIDLILPEDMTDGFIWVSVVDVKGVVFHMLPNRTRPDNSVQTLLGEQDGNLIRVAYSIADATENGRLAFNVDDSVLGKSKVIVLYSDRELFGLMRPTSESTASYAQALQDARDTGALVIRSLDSAILTTAR
ncbi:MAG: hypothetical protein ACI9PY_003767 [Ascidiaceihabitans sp.]|jgi:hypothetical protein